MLLLAGIQINANAQDDSKHFAFSLGPELNLPSRSIYTIGGGASVKGEGFITQKAIVTGTAGYTLFDYKGLSGAKHSTTFVPLKVGFRYVGGPGAYLEGEVGDAIETGTGKKNLFAYSVGPGFIFDIDYVSSVDLSVRYENWSQHTLQQIAIRAAIRVGW